MERANSDLLARIASMYYEEDMTQAHIARETGYSRSMISRYLKEAKRLGIVEICVHHPLSRRPDLEKSLRERFGLRNVRVLDRSHGDYGRMLSDVGALAAQLVGELVADGNVIGMSWGTGLAEMVRACRPQFRKGVSVIQIIGAVGTANPVIDGAELARELARKFGGSYATLPAPLFVESEAMCQALKRSRQVQDVFNLAARMDIALVGVGTTEQPYASLVRSGHLTQEQLNEFVRAGAVGDVCALHFDIEGNLVDIPLQRRLVTIDPDTLRRSPIRLGIAAGPAKANPILGALRADFINALVTDETAATLVL
jgi:DNA-binding transcriptional regulator LsrR (DeoR family)